MEDKQIKAGIKRNTLTPDEIMNTLFTMHKVAHYYHLQTTSYAQHKALDSLYDGLQNSKDAICEYLLGIQAPRRFGALRTENPPMFSDSNLNKFIDDGIEFSVNLCNYGKEKGWEQLTNLASELQGLLVSTKYLLTLK